MWRGPVVQARKNAVNAVKGKIFSIHAKLIALAAQKWWNPDDNPSLFAAIQKAKKEWVPNDNIDRAIKKWTGEDNSWVQIQEIIYEWYAPWGIALMVETLTDNKNRTVGNIRNIFTKYWGNLWESGAVSWIFHKKWVIFIDPTKHSYEMIEELVFETEADDIIMEAGYIKIISSLEKHHIVEWFFEQKGIELYESKISYIPDNEIEVTEFEKALKFTKMIQAFDEDEDVNRVASNEVLSPELQKEVDDFIEKNTFRT